MEAHSFTSNSVLLNLKCHKPGNSKKVRDEQVKVVSQGNEKDKIAQDRVSVSMQLLNKEAKAIKAIGHHFRKVQGYVEHEALPVTTIRSGMHAIAHTKVVPVTTKLKTYVVELAPLVDDFEMVYPQLVEEAFEKLGPLADPMNFPPFSEVRAEISITWEILTFEAPTAVLGKLDETLAVENEEKLRQHTTSMVEQLETALALSVQASLEKLSEDLQPGDDGKAKRFTNKTIEKYNAFFGGVLADNITKNEGLASLVAQARALINDATPAQINASADIRKVVSEGMARITQELSELTVTETGRHIVLRPRKQTAVSVQQSTAETTDNSTTGGDHAEAESHV